MNNVLLLIFFVLLIYVAGKRGVKLFIALGLNFMVLIASFYIIALGISPIVTALAGCLVVCCIVLFFVNGDNFKTRTSFWSTVIVLLLLTGWIYFMTYLSRIAGFGYESYEEINMFSYDVNIDYTKITAALILLGLIGAVADSSMAISSALYEVFINNPHLSKKELFKSGLNIGRDILGTTINTLFFSFLGEFMTLVIWFDTSEYSFAHIINNKTLASELIIILFSAIGCVMILPITSFLVSRRIKEHYNDDD